MGIAGRPERTVLSAIYGYAPHCKPCPQGNPARVNNQQLCPAPSDLKDQPEVWRRWDRPSSRRFLLFRRLRFRHSSKLTGNACQHLVKCLGRRHFLLPLVAAILVFGIAGSAEYLRGLVIEQCDGGMVRSPLAPGAIIVDIISKSHVDHFKIVGLNNFKISSYSFSEVRDYFLLQIPHSPGDIIIP